MATCRNGTAGNGTARPRATKCTLQVFEKGSKEDIGSGYFNSDLLFDATNHSFVKDFEEPSTGGHSPFALFIGSKAKETLKLDIEEKANIRKLIEDGKFE